jgi:methylase of polypeptide subunit release factors
MLHKKTAARFACTTENYNALYTRYLKNPARLLEMTAYKSHHTLLDLCGGTGAISLAALSLGADPAHITLLDLNPRCPHKNIRQIHASAIDGIKQLTLEGKNLIASCAGKHLLILKSMVNAAKNWRNS